MRSLALMEQGTNLSVEGELFRVERSGVLVDTVRMGEIDEVLVFGQVCLSPPAINAMLHRGMDVIFLTARGQYRGRLVSHAAKNVELRVRQYQRLHDVGLVLEVARAIVAGKIANQRNLLLRGQREQKREDLTDAIAGMRRMLLATQDAPTVDSLRGVEGQAAALYFGALGKCFRNPAFSFSRRSRRPPLDPPNAILSFGYTLLGSIVESLVARVGLDPMLGTFHTPEFGRPSLALDLMEELRPVVVDGLMLRLINRREVTPEDFERIDEDVESVWAGDAEPAAEPTRPQGVWLGESGRRVFFRAWGRRLRETMFYEPRGQTLSLEQIAEQQVQRFARALRGEEPYAAFVPR
jgi:CRISPR-associated protein Cas1